MDAWPMDGPILLHARAYLITRKKIAWEGDRQMPPWTDIATTRSNQPSALWAGGANDRNKMPRIGVILALI